MKSVCARVIVAGLAALLMVLAGGSSAFAVAQTPLQELTTLCAGKQGGLVRYIPSSSSCNSFTETRLSLPANAPVQLCILPGVVRSGPPCVPLETPLTLPGTGPTYFCALPFVGYLRLVTAPSQCASTETPVVVSVPVATGDAFSVNEDATLSPTAPGVLANDSDALGNPLTAQLVTGPAHVASFTLNGNGSFSYTPSANFNGADSFVYRVTDGTYTSTPATVAITVTPVNDAPSFVKGPDQSVLQDAGPQTVTGWATGISPGPPNESGQTVVFTVTSTNPGLFSAGPVVSPTGVLTYTPAAGANGVATVTAVLKDNGGTANGGVDTSAPQMFTITVIKPNAVPVANGDAYTLNEDGVLNQTAPGVLGNDTDADHDPLTAKLVVGPPQASSFTLHADGSFAYTPNANFCGTGSFTYKANDGKADSNVVTVTLTVTCVNDVPSFVKGPDQTVGEDAGPQTVNPWATAISAGPANESGQALTFTVTTSNPGLFSTPPAVSPTGALTYTSAPNAYGLATVTVVAHDNGGTANGGVDTSAPQTFTITVTSVNDPPSFIKGADQTVNEDAGAQTVNPWATAISPGPPDESTQTMSFSVTNNSNPALFATGPAVSPAGVLTYAAAPNAFGTATITLVLKDNGGGTDTSAPQTFVITVNPVNDVPSFLKGPDQSVLQDAGPQTVTGWATAISPGPANESGQTLAFTVTATNPGLFSAGPAVSPTGVLSYTPAAGANGVATVTVVLKDNGGTANGGVDTSAPQAFTITVIKPNAIPVANNDAATLNEDGVLNQAAPGVLGNDTDADLDPLTAKLVAAPGQAQSFTLHADGSFAYIPNANFCGTDFFTYKANDGKADSPLATVTLTVICANDAPSFTKGPDQTVGEDAGLQTVNPWASAISAGPPNESSQTLTFTITNNTNLGLFSTGPAVSAAGALTYTPAVNANGTATITVVLKDNGGTANGGVDTSAPQTFTITVTQVNDPPSFTKGPDQTANEDAGPQTVNPWATAISPGPPDESAQTVSFSVTSNSNPALFSAGPAVSPTGVLTYTAAPNANGTATITVVLKDSGGGTDTSAPQSFIITVNPVNDAPVGVVDKAHAVTGNVRVAVPVATGLLQGVSDIEGDAVTAQVDPSNASTGDIVINSDGSYFYDPKPGREGVDTVKFKVCDNGTPSACSAVYNLTLTVSNSIWFIDNGAAAGGTGRLTAPFSSLSAFTAVNNGTGDNPAPGDTIFLDRRPASYTGPLTLLNNQKVIGKGASVSIDAAAGITLAPDSDPLPPTSGTSPVITTTAAGTNGITLAIGNTVRGLTVGNTTGSGIAGTNFGTLTVLETAVNGSGQALNLNNGSFAAGSAFTEVSSTSGATGFTLVNVNGNADLGGGAITGSTGAEVDVNGGSGSLNYAGSVTNTVGQVVSIRNRTGGTFTLAGQVSDTIGSGTGVLLNSNGSGTVTFSGGLTLSTGANPAFTATNGGTVTVTGSNNTLNTGTGTALTVTNTTIGAAGLTVKSISSNGAASGIVLNNTGSAGGLTVTGTGSPASGGTIQASTGDGIVLTSTSNVSLSWMDVKTSANDGINGTLVTNLSLTSLRIQNNTNALVEAGLLLTNLRGTSTVTNTEVSGSTEDNVRVINDSGTLNGITFSGCTVKNNSTASGNVGIGIQATNTAVMNGVVISGCTFTGNRSVSLSGDTADSSQLNITAQNNVITAGSPNQGNQGIEVSSSLTSQMTFDINGNKVGTDGTTNAPLMNTGINVFAGNNSTVTGKVRNNTVVNAGAGQSGFGIRIAQSLNSVLHAKVDGNTVSNVGLDYGILADAGSGSSPAAGQASLDVALTNNNVSVLPGALDAIRAQARTVNTVCARIANNTTNAGGAGFFGLFVRQAQTGVFKLEGLTGAVNTYLTAQNPSAATVDNAGTISSTPANSCNIPN